MRELIMTFMEIFILEDFASWTFYKFGKICFKTEVADRSQWLNGSESQRSWEWNENNWKNSDKKAAKSSNP